MQKVVNTDLIIERAIVHKHNSLTDGYINKSGNEILPDKLINALYYKYEKEGTNFVVSKSELRGLLNLKSSRDDVRIENALTLLSTPMQIRNFEFEGKKVKWSAVSLINAPTEYEGTNAYEITISKMMLAALKQKIGYTPISLAISNKFQTKYGIKLYEMYLRYESLPNKNGENVGTISKTLDELNKMFAVKHKYISKMEEGLNRGIREIREKAYCEINCYWDKKEKIFVFSWWQNVHYQNLRIPEKRIDELIDWYISHEKPAIKNPKKYRESLQKKILNDDFGNIDEYWAGMLIYKYAVPKEEVRSKKYYNSATQKWLNF